MLVSAGVYAAGAVQDAAGILPPWNWWSAPFVAVAFALLWGGVDLLAGRAWPAGRRAPTEPGAAPPAGHPGGTASAAAPPPTGGGRSAGRPI